VSCPAAATCFGTVASGAIDKTTDGGKKWKSKTTSASGLTAISCASATHCVALANAG
jgi:photosystem II stability/assembly factor-like uncharacterized protein